MMEKNETRAEEFFRQGVEHLRSGESLKALSFFEKSFALKETASCRSYLGLLRATERGSLREGIAVCEEAVRAEPSNHALYLNLGKLLYMAGRRQEGIEAVRKGLEQGHDEDAVAWLEEIGVRNKPVFSFLPRDSFLNKLAGLILSRLGLR